MKVKALIELLSELNPEHEVVLSGDGEGNSYSPLADHGVGRYTPESTWSGEFSSEGDPDEGYCTKKEVNAVVLWPTN